MTNQTGERRTQKRVSPIYTKAQIVRAQGCSIRGCLVDISEKGAAIEFAGCGIAGEQVSIRLSNETVEHEVRGSIRYCLGNRIGVSFDTQESDLEAALKSSMLVHPLIQALRHSMTIKGLEHKEVATDLGIPATLLEALYDGSRQPNVLTAQSLRAISEITGLGMVKVCLMLGILEAGDLTNH